MFKKITSVRNPRLKAAIRLKASRGRKTQQRIIIFGLRESLRAMTGGFAVQEVFVCRDQMSGKAVEELRSALPSQASLYEASEEIMQRLQYGDRQEAVVCVAQRPDLSLGRLAIAVATRPLVVILEGIEKPGNIGAVLRSADGAGASAVILADPQCDVLHPNCIRASLGSGLTMPLAIGSGSEVREWCRETGLTVVAFSDRGEDPYTTIDWSQPLAMALGSEAHGLSPFWMDTAERTAAIPMRGIVDSLNISAAAAVVLYEAHRQRSAGQQPT